MSIIVRCRHAVTVMVVLLMSSSAMAQSPLELLKDFVHYTLTARPDLATASVQALLQTGIDDSEIAELVDDEQTFRTRFDTALARAHRISDLQDIAADMDRRVHEGRLALSRRPARIEEAIQWLIGAQRQRMFAKDMLVEAGEYAVPALLKVVAKSDNQRLREACLRMLIEIGRQSVTPLGEALRHLDPANQRLMCGVLGEIGLPHASAYLLELSRDSSVPQTTRDAADRAFRRASGVNGGIDAAYTRLAQQYFNESESLIAFPLEETNNVWSYDSQAGLEAMPVPTEIFAEVMAMRSASRALVFDDRNRAALALFVASNLRRDNELPRDAEDPIYGENPYTPEFYATVFGTEVCMDVLAMALDRKDTALARDAIDSLSATTGGSNLFVASAGGRQPLLEALQYQDRRVQYDAALTVANALPGEHFAGDVRVVPLLASAVRSGGESYVAVITADDEDRRIRSSWLDDIGFTVVAAGPTVSSIREELIDANGIDLVVLQVDSNIAATEAIDQLRVTPRTEAAPVLVVVSNLDLARLRNEFRDDPRIHLARSRASQPAFEAAINDLLKRAAGGRMTEPEAERYAINAIMALRDIAITGNLAYMIADAESTLIDALAIRSGGLRLKVGDILALIDTSTAQRALFDAALNAEGDERIELLDRVSVSVKRYGNQSAGRHVEGLLALIRTSGGPTADAAARVHGSLVLPTDTAIELIPE